MRTKTRLALAVMAGGLILISSSGWAENSFTKYCNNAWCYQQANFEGWNVYFSENLALGDKALFGKTRNQVSTELKKLKSVLPKQKLSDFQQIKVFVSSTDPSGRHTHCVYHHSREVLLSRGADPEKFQNVEIANSSHYLRSRRNQPAALLHEFAHAYIHRFLNDREKEELASVFREAMKTGMYRSVPYFDGETTRPKKAYASTDFYEYFAEATEAYFWKNDYFPFTRDELRAHDSRMYSFLRRLWGK